MIWHLFALAAAGLGAAGVGFLLRAASGRKLPKWIVPACAGLGMLTYQIYFEYYWFEHKQSQLPASSVVVASETQQAIWRPWTYLIPMTVSFSVVDRSNLMEIQVDGNLVKRFILYRFQKEYVDLVSHHTHLLNCDTMELVPEADDGSLRLDRMRKLNGEDPLYLAVCR
jgi:hypothetical protein